MITEYGRFIAVTSRRLYGKDFYGQIEKILARKPYGLILREKDLEEHAYEEMAKIVMEMCKKQDVLFFVHSNVCLAEKIGCKNIHLPIHLFWELVSGPNKERLQRFCNISVSCHSVDEAVEAERNHATMIVLGTIFETACKPGKKGSGLELIRQVREKCSIEIYAIGGINEQNIEDVIEAGAAGGCMMSGFIE